MYIHVCGPPHIWLSATCITLYIFNEISSCYCLGLGSLSRLMWSRGVVLNCHENCLQGLESTQQLCALFVTTGAWVSKPTACWGAFSSIFTLPVRHVSFPIAGLHARQMAWPQSWVTQWLSHIHIPTALSIMHAGRWATVFTALTIQWQVCTCNVIPSEHTHSRYSQLIIELGGGRDEHWVIDHEFQRHNTSLGQSTLPGHAQIINLICEVRV
jgi:hypothetical protein